MMDIAIAAMTDEIERNRAAIAELVAALKDALIWHQGDKWRDGTTSQRQKWEEHTHIIRAAIAKHETPTTTKEEN